jgi:integrase
MDPANDDHQQASLEDAFDSEVDQNETTQRQPAGAQHLVEQYLTSRRTSGSQAYAASAESVLRRWAAWLRNHDYRLEALDDSQQGPRILNEYALTLAQRVHEDTLSASTAERYFAYISACLSYGVRQGVLDRNPALTETAKEDLPEHRRRDRTDQQFWSPAQREAIVAFVDDQAASAQSEKTASQSIDVRNRALVRVLAYSGVRGAEVFSHPDDDREGRCGLWWEHVDLEAGTMLVFGKSQAWERTPLPSNCLEAVGTLEDQQQPASDEWPVFTTGHMPSLAATAREELGQQYEQRLAETDGGIWALLRTHDITPPALTTSGARKVMQRLTEQAGIEVEEGYLTLHGARRGLGDLLYRQDRGHAQDILRHNDLSTTQDAYQHIDAEERREQLDAYLEGGE